MDIIKILDQMRQYILILQLCKFCNRCESYQATVDNDKIKAKNKKDIEGKCNILNYFVLLLVLIFILGSNLIVWLWLAMAK